MKKEYDLNAIKKELVFLIDNQADVDYRSRIRRYRSALADDVSKAQGKVGEFKREAQSHDIPIELEYPLYVEWANDYIYRHSKNTLPNLPTYPLDSGFFKSIVDRLECKTTLGAIYNIKDVREECLIVKPIYLKDGVEYEHMPFTSNTREIVERFEGFTTDDLLYGEYFIYFPKYALDWLIGFKDRYDFYVSERDRAITVSEDLEDIIKGIEEM